MDDRTTGSSSNGNTAPPVPAPRSGPDGKPVYDQEFFIALALCGKQTWNAWRQENANVRITFEDVNFEALNAAIDFSDFTFGVGANFSSCRFGDGPPLYALSEDDVKSMRLPFHPGMAKFNGASFGSLASFHGAVFGNQSDLSGVTFEDHADFAGAHFGEWSRLSGATFGPSAVFFAAVFGTGTNLSNMTIGPWSNLSGTTFGDSTNLSGATFYFTLDFSGSSFGEAANLSAATFGSVKFDAMSEEKWREQLQRFFASEKREQLCVMHRALRGNGGLDRFKAISFAGARFDGDASFNGRKFDGPCNFTGATFKQLPDFDGCEGVGRIDLSGAKISFAGRLGTLRLQTFGYSLDSPERHAFTRWIGRRLCQLSGIQVPGWTTDSLMVMKLRTLRKVAEDTKNHDLERDLYICEREAERGIVLARCAREAWKPWIWPGLIAHLMWIAAMAIYWVLSDYGRSFVRPLVALILSVFIFNLAYAHVIRPPIVDNRPVLERAIKVFSIANAVPFVGALSLEKEVKQRLLCGDQPTEREAAAKRGVPPCASVPSAKFQAVTLSQSIFSALCFFFAGLALRNYFKVG